VHDNELAIYGKFIKRKPSKNCAYKLENLVIHIDNVSELIDEMFKTATKRWEWIEYLRDLHDQLFSDVLDIKFKFKNVEFKIDKRLRESLDRTILPFTIDGINGQVEIKNLLILRRLEKQVNKIRSNVGSAVLILVVELGKMRLTELEKLDKKKIVEMLIDAI